MTFGAIEISESLQQGLDTLFNSFSDSVSADGINRLVLDMERTALTFDPAYGVDLRSRGNRPAPHITRRWPRDARSIPANGRSAESAATEPVATRLASGLTAETLHDVVDAQSRAVVPARSGSDVAPRPDLAMLSYLRALEALLRDRAASPEIAADRDHDALGGPGRRTTPAARNWPRPHSLDQTDIPQAAGAAPPAPSDVALGGARGAEAARQGCSAADVFVDRAGRQVPGLRTLSDAAAARDRGFASTPRETPRARPAKADLRHLG